MTTRTVTTLGFVAIATAAVVWALVARGPRWATLPEAWDVLRSRRTVRVLLVLGWIWLGWHLFARGSGAFD